MCKKLYTSKCEAEWGVVDDKHKKGLFEKGFSRIYINNILDFILCYYVYQEIFSILMSICIRL